MDFKGLEVWFVTGAQLLYGGDAVVAVDSHSTQMVKALNDSGKLPVKIVYKGTANSSPEVEKVFKEANNDTKCVGVITWMHTFSPAKMWIKGLQNLRKPLMHLHTQFNKEIPWNEIDMDFMNLNQSAHGDREFGHMVSRMRKNRKVVVGHWSEEGVQAKIANWMRVCAGWADSQDMLIIRFGDNMNNVAVTDGDKVEAEMRLGYHVDNAPIATLVPYVEAVTDAEIDALITEYEKIYDFAADCKKGAEKHQFVRDAAAQEIGLRRFLQDKGAKGFTTSFNELAGMKQLMGFASQRLMAEGYGFGAEGDWKSAALVRTMWVMGQGLPGGQSFLEDYTLNFDGENSTILQSHMLEINPDITGTKPRIEVHFLGIGDARTCARLVFQAHKGEGVAATIVDMGNRFRMIVNEVKVVEPKPLPKLPVACALWKPMPNLEVGAGAWILAGGTHHSSFSFSVTTEMLEDYADIAGIELVTIDENTTINNFKFELKVNEVYYLLNKSLN
ncbi:MAG: L-arabinose isomerase [Prevotella sp.]|jgi:L-arabinose isomerase|uniref:L-arabinose isomerase n=1 Tax=unclassified Dysgonomonas TaxID=2630389 RepID=UPI0025BC3119|nr:MULTISPECIES: L-arabinose isomerase [unclassified Dysgonomonas]MDR1715152.1 L-arabinose isomerase [Prevotella sp.]MDR2003575.1 L-arabinose isomerase [Prevotella sp.]HMM03978.1 L-arabinose isomerase [Dysgonomonas sp.]